MEIDFYLYSYTVILISELHLILHKCLIQIRLCVCPQSFTEHIQHCKQLICAQEAEKHILPLRGSEDLVCFCSFSRTCMLFIDYLIYYEYLPIPINYMFPGSKVHSILFPVSSSMSCSVAQWSNSVIQWIPACQLLCPSLSRSLVKLMSIKSTVPSSHLILCCSLLLPPSIFPNIRVFPLSWLFASGG